MATMAAVQSTSFLSRMRSGRVPNGKPLPAHAAARDSVSSQDRPVPTAAPPTPVAPSNTSIFLTNLHLLDLDLLPDWPGITVRTFATKDAGQGQKRRVQCVEWALYHLFCLWDADEAARMAPYFPPGDHTQSVNLRAALLRALEQTKKNGTLGRDAIIRKTMLDECRGERLEEILAVFSSAVLKKAVTEDQLNKRRHEHPAVAKSLALEDRGYSAERTQLTALVLAHKGSLDRTLRSKAAARARYQDFAELLDLKQRSIARRREAAKVAADKASASAQRVSDSAKRDLWRMVRNNWSGSEQWMETLLCGDGRGCSDGVLTTSYDRVWRRVQAGRLSELENTTESGGLLEQMDKRVRTQQSRLKQWEDYRKGVFGKRATEAASSTTTTTTSSGPQTRKGIDLGFGAHDGLYPTTPSPRKRGHTRGYSSVAALPPIQPIPERQDEYTDLVQGLAAALTQINRPPGPSLVEVLRPFAAAPTPAEPEEEEEEEESEISDIEDHAAEPPAPPPAGQSLVSPRTAQRALLTKKSLTFSVKSFDEDEEPEPPQLLRRVVTQIAAAKSEREPKRESRPMPSRRKRPSHPPPIVVQTPPRQRAPSPDASPSPSPSLSPSPPPPPTFELQIERPERHERSERLERVVSPDSPSQELADQILASMNNASPSPIKKSRHTLSLAERTRMSMARLARNSAVHDFDEPDFDALDLRHPSSAAQVNSISNGSGSGSKHEEVAGYEDLITRTRKSMAGFEASRQKAQMERRRSQRKSRIGPSSVPGRRDAGNSGFSTVEEGDSTLLLTEELMAGEQDDAEAIFRSRPKIVMSPVPMAADDDYDE